MKQIDMTKTVMEKVIRFERKRSFWWLGKFFFILLLLCVMGAWLVWMSITQIAQRQTLELLTLFTQDREIIAQFWQDTIMVIWEELPQSKIIIFGIILGSIVMFIVLTRKRRMIIWKRIRQIIHMHKEDYE